MVVFNSLQPEKKFKFDNIKGEMLNTRLKHLFNHHSFINYMAVSDGSDAHLVRYSTLNQPYNDPTLFSVIIKPSRFEFDLMDLVLKRGSFSLNHLPFTTRDINRAYKIPNPHTVPKLSETGFSAEYFSDEFSTPCISEASVKMGMIYDSHLTIVKDEMVLFKMKMCFLAYDELGATRLTSPILNIKDALRPKLEMQHRRAI